MNNTKLTNQSAFDLAVGGLLAQGCKSQKKTCYDSMICQYRGYEGRKCGVGFLLTDTQAKDFDELDISVSSCDRFDNLAPQLMNVSIDLLIEIQHTHDHEDTTAWHTKFKSMASKHNLKWTH